MKRGLLAAKLMASESKGGHRTTSIVGRNVREVDYNLRGRGRGLAAAGTLDELGNRVLYKSENLLAV